MDNNNNTHVHAFPSSSRTTDRKFIERNRRNQMKTLYSNLNSLLPHHQAKSKEVISVPDQLHEATNYIKKLQMKVERMKEKKEGLMGITDPNSNNESIGGSKLKSPRIEIQHVGEALEVVVTTGLDSHSIFTNILRLLHQEGADILHASYSVVEDAVFHIIHSQVGECGDRAARISEKLRRYLYGSDAF